MLCVCLRMGEVRSTLVEVVPAELGETNSVVGGVPRNPSEVTGLFLVEHPFARGPQV